MLTRFTLPYKVSLTILVSVFISALFSITPDAQPLPLPTPAVPPGFRGIDPQTPSTLTPVPAAPDNVPPGFRGVEPVIEGMDLPSRGVLNQWESQQFGLPSRQRQTGQIVTFLQNFESNHVYAPNEREAALLQEPDWIPTGEISGCLGAPSTIACAYHFGTGNFSTQVRLEVDLRLGPLNDPSTTYTVFDFEYSALQRVSPLSQKLDSHTVQFNLKGRNGEILYVARCSYDPEVTVGCNPVPVQGSLPVSGAYSWTILHSTDQLVNANTTSIYALAVDDLKAYIEIDTDCSDDTIDIAPYQPDYVTQVASDMNAIANENGLIIHANPLLNADRNPANVIGWGTNIRVRSRVAFVPLPGFAGQQGTQIWYEVEDANENSLGWIAARFVDHRFDSGSGQWSNIDQFYVQGMTTSIDPCTHIPAPTASFTMAYDRVGATIYAMAHSYQNELLRQGNTLQQGRATERLNQFTLYSDQGYVIPYGDFVSIDLFTSGTASAMFTSESIWMGGGLPMTIGYTDPPTGSCHMGYPVENVPGSGWRFCWREDLDPDRGNTSPAWDVHKGLLEYYTEVIDIPIPSSDEQNTILAGQKGYQLTFPDLNSKNFIEIEDLRKFVDNGEVFNQAGLAAFAAVNLANLTIGDYMWIDTIDRVDPDCQRPDPPPEKDCGDVHGLLVTGWGEVADCPPIMTVDSNTINNLGGGTLLPTNHPQSPLQLTSNGSNVPYVADYTTVQPPVPRPFYCTNYRAPANTNFFPHSWYFFHLPDQISLAWEKLYVPINWGWRAP